MRRAGGLHDPALRLAVERVGAPAERSIFLDDFEWNLTGATAIGMHTMNVTDISVAAAELRERLGLAAPPNGTA